MSELSVQEELSKASCLLCKWEQIKVSLFSSKYSNAFHTNLSSSKGDVVAWLTVTLLSSIEYSIKLFLATSPAYNLPAKQPADIICKSFLSFLSSFLHVIIEGWCWCPCIANSTPLSINSSIARLASNVKLNFLGLTSVSLSKADTGTKWWWNATKICTCFLLLLLNFWTKSENFLNCSLVKYPIPGHSGESIFIESRPTINTVFFLCSTETYLIFVLFASSSSIFSTPFSISEHNLK